MRHAGSPAGGQLHRTIDWTGAFWVASGVPALVLFSIGGIAGTAGKVAFVVWTVSMIMGFIQSFTYAEIAGLFPEQVGRRVGLWRGRVAALLEVHRAAVGVVQLARLDAGAVARLLDRGRLHPQRAGAGPGVAETRRGRRLASRDAGQAAGNDGRRRGRRRGTDARAAALDA